VTKTIGIFTTTRAEFGAYIPLIQAIDKVDELDYLLFVGGAHLSNEYGNTIDEIKNAGVKVTKIFDYLLNENTTHSIVKSCGQGLTKLASIFEDHKFDLTCFAGDRYELIPIALSSILYGKPIIHLYGGEVTEGVIDDQIRHMLTKSAHIHFSSCELYAENIKKMGEEDWRVHSVGELVIDNVKNIPKLEKNKLFSEIGIKPNKQIVLLTYHPESLKSNSSPVSQLECIVKVLKSYDCQVVLTAPNVEVGSNELLEYINKLVKVDGKFIFIPSLGIMKYYNLLPYCKFLIGNSSSGLLEAPYFRIPAINVGNRQKGRILHQSVINTECDENKISAAIKKIDDKIFKKLVQSMEFKFGNGNTAKQIVSVLTNLELGKKLLVKKLDFNNQ